MECKTNCVKMMSLGKKNVSKQQKTRIQFHLNTILIPNQAVHHPNQRHHILDHGHPKQSLKQSRSYISGVMATITLNSYTHCLQDSYYYLNLKILVTQFIKNFKMQAVRLCSFLLRKIYTVGIPKPMVLVIIFRVFIWLLSFINAGEEKYPYADIRNFTAGRRTRSFQKESDNNRTSSSSYDD